MLRQVCPEFHSQHPKAIYNKEGGYHLCDRRDARVAWMVHLQVVSHHHEGFWLDVSTLRNFYDVNLQLASSEAPLSVEEIHKGIVSRGVARSKLHF
jgi:ADP-glucose pyrophosphorylase